MKISKVLKKIAAFTAIAVCFSTMCIGVSAKNGSVNMGNCILAPYNIAITNARCILTMDSPGTLTCYGDTYVISNYKAGITVELQKLDGDWDTIKTWTSTANKEAIVNENWYVTKGYSYRLKTSHYAYNSSGNLIEVIPSYSAEINYN